MIKKTDNIHEGIEKLAKLSPFRKKLLLGLGTTATGAGLLSLGLMARNRKKKKPMSSRGTSSQLLLGGPDSYKRNMKDFAHFNLPDGHTLAVHNSIKKDFFAAGNDLSSQLKSLTPHMGTKAHMFSPKTLTKMTPEVKRAWKNRNK